MRPYLPLLILAALQVGDVLSTGYSLTHGGREANPLAVFILSHGGLASFALIKLTAVSYAGLTYYLCRERAYRVVDVVIRGGCVLYALVVASNLVVGGLV